MFFSGVNRLLAPRYIPANCSTVSPTCKYKNTKYIIYEYPYGFNSIHKKITDADKLFRKAFRHMASESLSDKLEQEISTERDKMLNADRWKKKSAGLQNPAAFLLFVYVVPYSCFSSFIIISLPSGFGLL